LSGTALFALAFWTRNNRSETMDEEDRPVTRETTVINTGGDRGGGGGTIVALLVLAVIAIGAFLFFGGYLQSAADDLDVNVNVAAPKVELPDIKIETPPAAAPARQEPAPEPAPANGQ
jgi:hypothetical protein